MTAFFLATGPGLKPVQGVDIEAVDLSPIVLAALGIAPGEDMQGTVPDGLWRSRTPVASWSSVRNEITYVPSDDQRSEDVNESLRALGYVD